MLGLGGNLGGFGLEVPGLPMGGLVLLGFDVGLVNGFEYPVVDDETPAGRWVLPWNTVDTVVE